MTSKSYKEILQYFCRICGEITPGDTLTNKEKLKELGWKSKTSEDVEYVFRKQYKTLAENDNELVHPNKICGKCKGCVSSAFEKDMVIPLEVSTFQEHSDSNCSLCDAYQQSQKIF